jgi:hypothetical protein
MESTMTLNSTLKDSILFEIDENKSIEDASLAIRNGLANFFSTMNEERDYAKDYERILDLTEESIKKYANSEYKFNTALEPNEIEQIKKALISYTNHNEKVNEFKIAILEDLTTFQKQILSIHRERITQNAKEKELCEKQLRILECEKNKLIMDRLAKIVWPYDAKTKEYDQQITQLQVKVEQYTSKIANLKAMRPAANEKDILLYKIQLREKFATK